MKFKSLSIRGIMLLDFWIGSLFVTSLEILLVNKLAIVFI